MVPQGPGPSHSKVETQNPASPRIPPLCRSALHYYLTTPPHLSTATSPSPTRFASPSRVRPRPAPPPQNHASDASRLSPTRRFVGERVGVAARFVFTTTPNVIVVLLVLWRGFWARFSFHEWLGVSRFTDRRSFSGIGPSAACCGAQKFACLV